MKKYPLLALVFLLLLLVGTAFGLRDAHSTGQEPACLSPCFWGFVHQIERQAGSMTTPPSEVEVPSEGATVELWYSGQRIDTQQTDGVGEYCFSGSWPPGDYVIKVACLHKQVHRGGNENIRVDFLFRSPCPVVPPPPANGEPVHGEPGNPQP
jgi:hypothetical protein